MLKTCIYANEQLLAACDETQQNRPIHFYLHDRLGSVRQIIAFNEGISTVNVNQMYTYKPFGGLLEEDGSFDNSFMFAGRLYDSEIGQYYMRARQYDPYLCRFTSRDLMGEKFAEPLTLHRCLYCINDPISRIDLTGGFGVPQAALRIVNVLQVRNLSFAAVLSSQHAALPMLSKTPKQRLSLASGLMALLDHNFSLIYSDFVPLVSFLEQRWI